MEQSPQEIAVEMLRTARLEELRREAARNKNWAKLLRGFRPQGLSREMLLSHANQFAANSALMRDLTLVLLRGAGVPEGGRLEDRLAAAAANPDLPDDVRRLCAQLAGDSPAAPPTDVTAATISSDGGGEETPPQPAESIDAQPAAKPARRRAISKPAAE